MRLPEKIVTLKREQATDKIDICPQFAIRVFLDKEATLVSSRIPRIVSLSSCYTRDRQPGCLAYVASKDAFESLFCILNGRDKSQV